MPRPVLIALLATLALESAGQDATPPEPTKLTDLRIAWQQANDRDARPIKGKYLDALIALEDKLTRNENLTEAVVVRNEIELLTQGSISQPSEEEPPPELGSLRAIFDREMDRIERANHDKFIGALRILQEGAAKERKLDASLVLQAELTRQVALRDSELAALELIDSPRGLEVDDLHVGARRLSGHYQPPFDKVTDGLAASQYTRVPWQSTLEVRVRVTKSGFLYAIPASKANLKTTGLAWADVENALAGPYIRCVVKARARAGHEFVLNDFELCLIAKEITPTEAP